MTIAAAPAPPALEAAGLVVRLGDVLALDAVDVRAPAGSLTAIVGPNGAGKSTLLRAAVGLVPVAAGGVLVNGRSPRAGRRDVAYVPQRSAVDWDFPITVREVVELGRYGQLGLLRRPRASDRAAVDEALERVRMQDLARRPIGALSGGQRQRAFVARALAQDTGTLLLDEPFAGIDIATEDELLDLLAALRDEGRSVIVIHHDLERVRERFDWAVLLDRRLVAEGRPEDALRHDHVRTAYRGRAPVAA